MTPIVNPLLFYLMNVSEQLWGISIAALSVSCMCFIAFAICFIYNFYEYEVYEREEYKIAYTHFKKHTITSIIAIVISTMLIVFIPRKQTIIEMMIANAVTADNVGAGVDAIKSAADYVVEAIKSLQ